MLKHKVSEFFPVLWVGLAGVCVRLLCKLGELLRRQRTLGRRLSDDITHGVINLVPALKGNATVVCSACNIFVDYFSDYPQRVKKAVNSYE